MCVAFGLCLKWETNFLARTIIKFTPVCSILECVTTNCRVCRKHPALFHFFYNHCIDHVYGIVTQNCMQPMCQVPFCHYFPSTPAIFWAVCDSSNRKHLKTTILGCQLSSIKCTVVLMKLCNFQMTNVCSYGAAIETITWEYLHMLMYSSIHIWDGILTQLFFAWDVKFCIKSVNHHLETIVLHHCIR